MKRVIAAIIICITVLSCVTTPPSGTANLGTNLDAALEDFSAYIAERLTKDTLTAVAVTDAPLRSIIGNYIADKLMSLLLNNAGLRMVSRQDFERVLAEQYIQAGPNFDEDKTAWIGHNLGWRTIIYTVVNPLQDAYHLSLRAVDVETGELYGTKTYILNGRDPILISMVNPNMNVERLSERETLLQPFDGRYNSFNLTVTANKTVYYDGDEFFVTLRSSEDCYFVLYLLDADNNMEIIYPNFYEKENNFLKANTSKTIPERSVLFLHEPYGEERILVYASPRPFNIPEDQYGKRPITRDLLDSPQALWRIESSDDGSKGMSAAPRGATGQISYTILPGK